MIGKPPEAGYSVMLWEMAFGGRGVDNPSVGAVLHFNAVVWVNIVSTQVLPVVDFITD